MRGANESCVFPLDLIRMHQHSTMNFSTLQHVGHCSRQTQGSACQVYEIQGWIHDISGQPVKEYIVLLREGVIGIKVKITLDWDPKGKQGPKTHLPDQVTIHQPREDYIRSSPQLLWQLKV